ncbi:MAG TPA: transporter substrate-binding domain-containing protein, partial [Oscillospiraceae bacterium]|nr:transporter substrate-binding domain-containing protein [Oscillospiraceae bacterium]
MKKLVLAMALILIVALALTGCTKSETPASQAPASEAPVSEAPRTFTVGFDASFPPYGYTDENGNYVGFDLDLAAEVPNAAPTGHETV